MRRLAVLACAAMLSAGAFSRDANSDFKMFLKRLLPTVTRAFETKNAKFFESISTPDFSESMGGKTTTRAESMAQMKQWFGMASNIKCSFKLLSSKADATMGTATFSDHTSFNMRPMKKGDKMHRIVMDMTEKQTWVRSGKGWKIKMIEQAKPMKMWQDGKPVDPSKMMGGGG